MAENENVVKSVDEEVESKPSFGAKVKEFFRKKTVALKQKPQIIPLLFLLIVSIFFMLALFKISQAIQVTKAESTTRQTGICLFITTLLSLLVLVSMLNSFPKRKKPSIFFIVLVGVMVAGMVACDVVYYVQMNTCLANATDYQAGKINAAQPLVLAHMILLGIFAVLFALLPVYAKLIRKIDTSIKLESATENMGQIDIEEDD